MPTRFPLLRSIWYVAMLVVLTLYWGLRVILSALVFRVPNTLGGVYDRAARLWSRGQLRAAGVEVQVLHQDRVPVGRPVIYVSNHQSWFDILSLASTLPDPVRFVSKKELARIPILGGAMRAAGHIFIDRQNRQRAFSAYDQAAEIIQGGTSAVVFAEGTRSRTGELLPFKKGPFVLAIAAQVPIIPVYCAGTFEIMPKGSIGIRPKPIALYFGEPIETVGLGYDDREILLGRVRAVLEGMRDRSRSEGREVRAA